MKTLEERLKTCTICKKREFDKSTGLICSLTKGKPAFDSSCPDFDADSNQIALQKFLKQTDEESLTVSGWLAFFLWVGIGCGAVISLIYGLISIFTNGLGWILSVIYFLGTLLPLVIVAIYAIIAFYKRKTNAVALAKTYIIMIIADGVLAIVLILIAKDTSMLPQALRQLVWGAIWFTYLMKSEQVKEMIPVETRTWQSLETALLTVYVVMETIFVILYISLA